MLRLDRVQIRKGSFELKADIAVQTGQISAVMGPSGAGKSTLVGAIAGFEPLNTGEIFWREQNITTAIPGDRPISMLFQDGNLFPHLTLAQNVGLGLRPDLRLSAAERAKVSEALLSVGLEGMEQRKPADVSGGQQSRAALARVLIQDKPLILLDEPFAALGPALKQEMLELLKALAERSGATVLMVTHNPEDARQIATHVVLVADGGANQPVETSAFFENPPEALQKYLGRRN